MSYNLVTQTPQYDVQSLRDLQDTPINSAAMNRPEILADVASIHRADEMAVVNHYNIRRVVDIYASVQDRDLGAVGRDVTRIVDAHRPLLPRGSFVTIRGQLTTMRSSYLGLLGGLVFSVVLVYLLIVVNFQSWLDPFVIITALPAALAGIILFLFVTGTTLSVPALMGAIMCMGVATANSILVVAFAKDRLTEHGDPLQAAIEAGFTRFRPVLMTALAMIIGMIPMALGLGDGGEQNAPLGRAVIGGLLCATVATLVFVPSVFALASRKRPRPIPRGSPKAIVSQFLENERSTAMTLNDKDTALVEMANEPVAVKTEDQPSAIRAPQGIGQNPAFSPRHNGARSRYRHFLGNSFACGS